MIILEGGYIYSFIILPNSQFITQLTISVTGGTGTLALHTARALLEHGLSGLALWDVNPLSPSAIAAINSLRTLFPSAQIFACAVDVRDPVSIQTALDKTIQEFGTVDILCCFAGVVSSIHALDISPEEWNKPIDVNLTGSFLASQALARQIVAQKSGGSIVLIASISGHTTNFPQPQVAYNASKAAVRSLTKSLAAEWSRYGIRVNCISPGYMDTILNEGEGLENCRRKWMERHPLGRMGDPWEVTGPVVMLVSNAGRYVNGADVVVDGGQLVF